jgi:hypothetical protein
VKQQGGLRATWLLLITIFSVGVFETNAVPVVSNALSRVCCLETTNTCYDLPLEPWKLLVWQCFLLLRASNSRSTVFWNMERLFCGSVKRSGGETPHIHLCLAWPKVSAQVSSFSAFTLGNGIPDVFRVGRSVLPADRFLLLDLAALWPPASRTLIAVVRQAKNLCYLCSSTFKLTCSLTWFRYIYPLLRLAKREQFNVHCVYALLAGVKNVLPCNKGTSATIINKNNVLCSLV